MSKNNSAVRSDVLGTPSEPRLAIFNRYRALWVSLAVHAGVIAWVQGRETTQAPLPASRPATVVEIVPPAPVEAQPTEVVLLPDDSVVPAAPVPGPAASRVAISSNRPLGPKVEASTTVVPRTGEPPPAQRSPLMAMRKPEQPTLEGPSADFIDTFVKNTRPIKPHENPTTRLEEDIAAIESNLKNPRWVANATADEVNGARFAKLAMQDELNNRELQPDGDGRKSEHKQFRVKVAADGSATIYDKRNIQRKGLGATFDVTDALMRSKGMDPYSSYKLKILDETREERVAMGTQHRTQQLAQSRQHMQKNLERLWSTTSDADARKRGLFELWDDCAETGSEELIAGGRSAREYIIGFIRSKYPAGSSSAFTREELRRFNRHRRSQTEFAPYGTI